MPVPTISWSGDLENGEARLVDQTLLPETYVLKSCRTPAEMWQSIQRLEVRGAPAIGLAGALGVLLGVRNFVGSPADLRVRTRKTADYLATSRPTAVNLFWALDRMKRVAECPYASTGEMQQALFSEALRMLEEDREICRALGRHGASLISDGDVLLTHCNAGGLATADYGTALACFFTAHEQGKRIRVFADETRPLLQGARLTAWELQRAGIDVTVICDNMAAHVMRDKGVKAVFTGADRIAANGDAANKIGTYGLATLARAHQVPFYLVAPASTFDLTLPAGSSIPIEERAGEEISCWGGRRTVPSGVKTYNPAFDVTPAGLITAIVTEHGILRPPDRKNVARLLGAVSGRSG